MGERQQSQAVLYSASQVEVKKSGGGGEGKYMYTRQDSCEITKKAERIRAVSRRNRARAREHRPLISNSRLVSTDNYAYCFSPKRRVCRRNRVLVHTRAALTAGPHFAVRHRHTARLATIVPLQSQVKSRVGRHKEALLRSATAPPLPPLFQELLLWTTDGTVSIGLQAPPSLPACEATVIRQNCRQRPAISETAAVQGKRHLHASLRGGRIRNSPPNTPPPPSNPDCHLYVSMYIFFVRNERSG